MPFVAAVRVLEEATTDRGTGRFYNRGAIVALLDAVRARVF